MFSAPKLAVDRVADSWGDEAPDWVKLLAEQADATSRKLAAKAIGYSAAVVSTVLGNAYRGDMARVEAAVRGAFLNHIVVCPVLGHISAAVCGKEQRQPLNTASPQRVQLYRACRSGCPHSSVKGAKYA